MFKQRWSLEIEDFVVFCTCLSLLFHYAYVFVLLFYNGWLVYTVGKGVCHCIGEEETKNDRTMSEEERMFSYFFILQLLPTNTTLIMVTSVKCIKLTDNC